MRLLHTPPLVLLALATPNDFPGWLRASHWINAFFIGYLIRSGIQILGSYPRLYWNDHCRPGHEWLTLTRHRIPTGRTWTSLEQELDVPLSFEHGAPLRLRCETVLGYKMVK